MYKFTFLNILLFFAFVTVQAQSSFSTKFSSASGEKRVEIYLTNGTLSISGVNGQSLSMNASGAKPLPDRAKGLKSLSRIATDNTGLGLEVKEANNVITIKQTASSKLEVSLNIPKDANLMIDHSGRSKEPLSIKNIEGEMEVSVNRSSIEVIGAVGPIVANSTGGSIEIKFKNLSQKGPTSINTVSGFIDITLPADSKANLELTTMSDDIFTDFDIKMKETEKRTEKEKEKRKKNRRSTWDCECGEKNIKGTINGGGAKVYLKSVRDNIYLRKG